MGGVDEASLRAPVGAAVPASVRDRPGSSGEPAGTGGRQRWAGPG